MFPPAARRSAIVDGLIFLPISVTQAALDEASPVVPLGEHLMASQRCRVAVDDVAASAQAVGHLLGLGRRPIAAVGAKRGSTAGTAELRLAGYRRADRGGGRGRPRTRGADRTLQPRGRHPGRRRAHRVGHAVRRAVCFNDLLALGAIEVLQQHGRAVPGDVAVVGFDDIDEGRHTSPALTTVAVDLAVLAEAAVDSLVRRLDDPSTPDGDRFVVPHRLVVRGSTVASPAADDDPVAAPR